MEKMIYSMIQVLIFAIAAVMVSTNPTTKQHDISPTTSQPPKAINGEEVKTGPKIFYLSTDPNDPIVCYFGIKFNITDNENKTTPQDEKNNQQIFTLSDDPLYTCRRGGAIPVNSTDYTVVENDNGGNVTNVTCIRRDYEKNISAIFIHQTGPLDTALNIFDRTIPYGVMTAKDWNKIDEKNVLKEYEVNCKEYGIDSGDKAGCSAGLAAALCG